MSSIAEQLTRINAAKESLSGVLVENGITPPATFEEYADAASGINLAYREDLDNLVSRAISAISSKATSIGSYAFYNCARLSTASFPVATSIANNALYNCTSLSTVSLPAATTIGNNAFGGCTSLSTVSLPAAISIGSNAFFTCTALSSLEIPACKTLTTPFRTSYSATAKLSNLVSLSLPSITTISSKAFGYSATQQYTGIVDLYFPNKTVAQVKAMSNYSTWHCGSGCTIHASDGSFLYGS